MSKEWMITLAVAVGSLALSALLYVLFDVVVVLFVVIPPAVYWFLRRRGTTGRPGNER